MTWIYVSPPFYSLFGLSVFLFRWFLEGWQCCVLTFILSFNPQNIYHYLRQKNQGFERLAVLCAQSCLTPCSPLDCSPPGFSVHGIPQVRTLEWVVISCSRVFSPPRDQTCISHVSWIGRQVLYHLIHEGRLSIDSNLIQQNKNHSIHL